MIHYQLRCPAEHGFDGWFQSSAAFESQAKAGLLTCPVCGATAITRALMAPALARGAPAPAVAPPVPPTPEPTPAPVRRAVTTEMLPDQMRAALQRLRGEIEKNCDYVGPTFSEEARRIHRGESARRAIYGEATPEQAEQLDAEGINIARIPWVPRADS
jgi:hypothetical protein|uniref:DUF1178 family protein n=1 Tax=Acidicaldus sp. TaxID=1872105 RepID=A0A8J4M6V8_9PROT